VFSHSNYSISTRGDKRWTFEKVYQTRISFENPPFFRYDNIEPEEVKNEIILPLIRA